MLSPETLLSNLVHFRTYAKYLPFQKRRETLEETINRNMQMHLDRFPKLSRDIIKAYTQVHDLKVMPSMRSLQFGGDAVVKNPLRSYNCCYTVVDSPEKFSEILFLLLSGTGVGFSVQKHHVEALPTVQLPREEGRYLIHDSIEGWAEALNQLMLAYFFKRVRPVFDFTQIRPRGSYLVTSGAKAPGPEPLKNSLKLVEELLKKAVGRKLRPIEVHDIICVVSEAVLAGGIRRAALISLFSPSDEEMLNAKVGNWWERHPYRARANNSAYLVRGKVTREQFEYIYDKCIESNAGEPGFFWSNDDTETMGTNPCAEIALNANQLCNLSVVNQTHLYTKKDFMNAVYAAALLGTLQASYTEFPYVSDKWRKQTEKEALIGVSFTGIADNHHFVSEEMLREASQLVLDVNEKYAKKIGINMAARTTCNKPDGTVSTVFGSSSGIHARHAPFYIRRVRMNKTDDLAVYLKRVIPELVEDDVMSSTGVVVSIPQASPQGSITRYDESALDLFKRVKRYYLNWIKPGHRSGTNTHNVSVTINYKPEEVLYLKEALWKDRNSYAAVSLLPFSDSIYKQAPFEDCDEATYHKLASYIKDVDLTQVVEEQDNTERAEQLACVSGVCEINL